MRFSTSAAIGGLLWATAALAQSEPPLLKGPEVKETSVPGESRTFGQGTPRGEAEIPHRLFQRALGGLRGKDVPAERRLTEEQDRAIRQAEAEFREQTIQYFESHREELKRLATALGVEIGPNVPPGRLVEMLRSRVRAEAAGGRPAAPAEAAGAMDDAGERAKGEAISRLRELSEGAPKVRDLHARVWALLSEAQREHMEGALKAGLDQAMAARRGEMGLAVTPGRKSGSPEQGMAEPKPITDINDPRLPERVRERLATLSPEEQARALERLNERMRQAWGRNAAGGDRRSAKPPPSMEEVAVPPPAGLPR